MNEPTNQKEDRAMKILAILGFVVIVIFIAWLAINFIRVLPNAFSSLASLADSVYNGDEEIELDVVSNETSVNSRESTVLTWTDTGAEGTYAFSYDCTDGVSLNVRTANNEVVAVNCDEPYVLTGDVFTLEVLFASERARFADVDYQISFTPADEDAEVVVAEKTLTIVNPRIPLAGTTDEDTDDEDDTIATGDDLPRTGAPIQYRTVKTVTYTTPESDPNGYTELSVRYLNVGILKNRTFVAKSTISDDDMGAFQFEVKNTGTKTSSTWSFTAELPSGTTYTSDTQEALKPNEHAIITVAFDNLGGTGVKTFGATIRGGNDQKTNNNDFTKTVPVRN